MFWKIWIKSWNCQRPYWVGQNIMLFLQILFDCSPKQGVCWLCTWRRLHNLLLCLLHHTCSPLVMDDSVSFFLKCHNKYWSYINTTIRPSSFKSEIVLKQAQWPFADVFNLKITDFCSCCIDTSLYRRYLQGKLPPYVQGVKNIYIKNIC